MTTTLFKNIQTGLNFKKYVSKETNKKDPNKRQGKKRGDMRIIWEGPDD